MGDTEALPSPRSKQPHRGEAAKRSAQTAPTSARGAAAAHSRGAGANGAALTAIPAALQRLEQRLEAERRQFDRQLQRLEKRVEEVACTSSSSGRWAELQGYVDGLSDTVQELVRNSDEKERALGMCAPMGPAPGAPLAPSAAAELARRLEFLEGKMDSATAVIVELRNRADSQQESSAGLRRQVVDMASRVLELEGQGDPRSTHGHASERSPVTPRVALQSHSPGDRRHDQGSGVHLHEVAQHMNSMGEEVVDLVARVRRVEVDMSAMAPLRALEALQHDVGDIAARIGAVVGQEPSETSLPGHDGVAQQLWDEDEGAFDNEDSEAFQQEWVERADHLQIEVEDLRTRLQDVEQGLQDVNHAQEVRQEVDQVGEQVMRLALRTQKVSRGWGAWDDETRELRRELGGVSEELTELWARVEGADCGLEGMAAALGRVCEELAELRSRFTGRDAASEGSESEHRQNAGGSGNMGRQVRRQEGDPQRSPTRLSEQQSVTV